MGSRDRACDFCETGKMLSVVDKAGLQGFDAVMDALPLPNEHSSRLEVRTQDHGVIGISGKRLFQRPNAPLAHRGEAAIRLYLNMPSQKPSEHIGA